MGAREKGAMAWIFCTGLGVMDTTSAPEWRESLARCLGSHNAARCLSDRPCHGTGCKDPATAPHMLSCSHVELQSHTHNAMLHRAVGRALRSSGVAFSVEDSTPLTGRLRMDVVTQPVMSTTDENDTKRWLLDITITNPTSNKHLAMSVQRSGHALAKAKQRKKTTYRGYFDPAYYTLKNLALSTCGDVGVDMLSFYKELAHYRVMRRNDWMDERELAAARGREMGQLRRRLSFVLQRALSQRTHLHLVKVGTSPPCDPAVTLVAAWGNARNYENSPRVDPEERKQGKPESAERGSQLDKVRIGSEERRDGSPSVEEGSEVDSRLRPDENTRSQRGEYANKHLPLKGGLCTRPRRQHLR